MYSMSLEAILEMFRDDIRVEFKTQATTLVKLKKVLKQTQALRLNDEKTEAINQLIANTKSAHDSYYNHIKAIKTDFNDYEEEDLDASRKQAMTLYNTYTTSLQVLLTYVNKLSSL
jgi:hypothetical protein